MHGTTNLNLFSYCGNDPVNKVDPDGNLGLVLTAKFASTLVAAIAAVKIAKGASKAIDEAESLPLPEIPIWVKRKAIVRGKSKERDKEANTNPTPPDVTYPGDDPTKAPDGTEWKGKGEAGSKNGNYYNPNTKECFHPDLNHPDPIGPHWDYKDPVGNWWRLFKDKIPSMKIK